jgi:hypothetical protein
MSFGEMIRIIQSYQENSEVPFELRINPKDKTIKIEYNKDEKFS